jgi:DNA-binding NarL/FixJ family response regulator
VRILFADNQYHVGWELRTLFSATPNPILGGEASEAGTLLYQVKEQWADLVPLDWELTERPTMDLLRDLQALDTPPRGIVVSSQPDDRQETLGDDAYEFVSEVDAPEHLPDGCRRLVQESKMAAEP